MREGSRRQPRGSNLRVLRALRIFLAIAAGVAWGLTCGVFLTPFWVVVLGGLAAAAFGFWLERSVLIGPETAQRKDFYLILAAALAFFAVVGVGIVSVSYILGHGWFPHLARR